MKHKSIDINQRIPLETISVALTAFLDDCYSEEYIIQQLRLEFKGENRLKKSIRIVNKIILKSPLSEFLLNNREEIKQAIKKKVDRNLILIALLNSAFPFSYDAFQLLGKFLSVQDVVNRETIKKSLSNIYGGNRATENALDSVIPMLIESGIINRPKLGLYQRNLDLVYTSSMVKSIFQESYKSVNSVSEIHDYQLRDPYFFFISNE
jgi:hypothetical protein